MTNADTNGNNQSSTNFMIFLACFMTLIAAGLGFSVRGGILADWSTNFGFTMTELGQISGGGLTGAGIIILCASFFVDKIGYKATLILAFLFHLASGLVTLAATPLYNNLGAEAGRDPVYWCLFIGMFLFAMGNGLCEAAINPLVATLYPKQKTHYLNILHAGWPAGLIIGGIVVLLFCGENAKAVKLSWEMNMLIFLIPTVLYGIIVFAKKFPVSEVHAAGITFGQMMREFLSPILILLLVLHALVGYVELGTDSWITRIMTDVMSGNGILVLMYTSILMFVLRFFAGPLVEKINPIGLLFVSSLLGVAGLYWLGSITTASIALIFTAATVYGFGKAFLWPTMLGVVGERFPRGGAITMGAVGAMGMLSAGMLGGPGIGYFQDKNASSYLQEHSEETYAKVVADEENKFLFYEPVKGLDGTKVNDLIEESGPDSETTKVLKESELYGGREALKGTAYVPAAMALGYLILLIYYASQGGYKQEHIHEDSAPGEEYTGGVEAPLET